MKTLQEIKIDIVQGSNPYYVYLLLKADSTPFYVGKGRSNRISAHEAETRYFSNGKSWKGINTFKLNTIKKIWDNGEQVFYSIDSFYETSEEAGKREIELVKNLGRRILGTGPLTNIRDGGDLMTEEDRRLFGEKIRQFYIDHPEAREKVSQRMKQMYIDRPELLEEASQRMKQMYIDRPELLEEMSQRMIQYRIDNPYTEEMKEHLSIQLKTFCLDHPEFIESLQEAKNDWIATNPEEYLATEKKRIAICQTEEHRKKVSEISKNYFDNNPEELERLKKQGADFWIDNPEAVDKARQNSIDKKTHEYILEWLRSDDPAVMEFKQDKYKRHSEWLTGWHQTEVGKEKTREAAKKRNEKIRTEEHRSLMSDKTKEFAANNPEAIRITRDKVKKTNEDTARLKQECYRLLEERLISCGKLDKKSSNLDSSCLYRWRKKGLIPESFPKYGGLSVWEDYLKVLQNEFIVV